MANQLCFRCFKIKGDYEVCPYCGYIEDTGAGQAYQLAPGTVLRERYIIGVSIGFGGFGITYKAFDTVLGIVVAIKEFYPAGLVNRGGGEAKVGIFSGAKEQEFTRQMNRFLEEARNTAEFSKEPDIINVFDYFEENQTAYIIMEYVDAPLLKERFQEGAFSQEEAISYMSALLDALAKVHAHGIVHKDISPDNIFLTGPDSIKLFDFGAARFEGTGTVRTEAMVVKAGYTPPEQYRSNDVQGPFTDIYAAGAVFYEMLTGEKPMDAPDRMMADGLKSAKEFGNQVDERLARVVLKALALEPQLRFQTAEEFKDAILNLKKVELPQELAKRQQRKKQVLTAALAAVIVVAGAFILLSQTLLSGKGKIDISDMETQTLDVWLAAEDVQKGERMAELLCDHVKQECPQLSVAVEVIDKELYAGRIEKAQKEQALPDVFCTDSMEAQDCCADLSKLFRTLKLSSYLYLKELERRGNIYEMPTAVQFGIAYANGNKLTNPPDSVDIAALQALGDTLAYADEDGSITKFQDTQSATAWLCGDLSSLAKVEQVTLEAMPPIDFIAFPVLEDGKLIGLAEGCYGVNRDMAESKQEAGMYIVSLLLGDAMQSIAYMDNEEGIPLNKEVLAQYKEIKMTAYLSFFRDYDLEDAQILENGEMCQLLRNKTEGEVRQ